MCMTITRRKLPSNCDGWYCTVGCDGDAFQEWCFYFRSTYFGRVIITTDGGFQYEWTHGGKKETVGVGVTKTREFAMRQVVDETLLVRVLLEEALGAL